MISAYLRAESGSSLQYPKAHDDVRPASRNSNQGCQLRPQARDLGRLIDEGMPKAKRARLQREPLAGAADPHPVVRVDAFGDEDSDAG